MTGIDGVTLLDCQRNIDRITARIVAGEGVDIAALQLSLEGWLATRDRLQGVKTPEPDYHDS